MVGKVLPFFKFLSNNLLIVSFLLTKTNICIMIKLWVSWTNSFENVNSWR